MQRRAKRLLSLQTLTLQVKKDFSPFLPVRFGCLLPVKVQEIQLLPVNFDNRVLTESLKTIVLQSQKRKKVLFWGGKDYKSELLVSIVGKKMRLRPETKE